MSDAPPERPAIDRLRVKASMRPARWFGGDHFGIALCVLIALGLLFLTRVALGDDPDAVWYRGTPALWLGSGLFALAIAAALGHSLRQRRLRHARLDQRGMRHAVERTRSECIVWGTRKSGKIWRWVAVATWHDGAEREHKAVAGPFDYDPSPLLDSKRLAVVADISDPEISRIVPDGLPPLRHARLSKEQRALAKPASSTVVTLVVLVVVMVLLTEIAWLVYPLLAGEPPTPLAPPR